MCRYESDMGDTEQEIQRKLYGESCEKDWHL